MQFEVTRIPYVSANQMELYAGLGLTHPPIFAAGDVIRIG